MYVMDVDVSGCWWVDVSGGYECEWVVGVSGY